MGVLWGILSSIPPQTHACIEKHCSRHMHLKGVGGWCGVRCQALLWLGFLLEATRVSSPPGPPSLPGASPKADLFDTTLCQTRRHNLSLMV